MLHRVSKEKKTTPAITYIRLRSRYDAAHGESLWVNAFFASPVPGHYVQTWHRQKQFVWFLWYAGMQTDRQTDRQTRLSQYSVPIGAK